MKPIKIIVLVSLFVCLSVGALYAQAVNLKTAYVNLSLIFDQYNKTKDYDGVLEEQRVAYEKDLNGKMEGIREKRGKLALLKEDEKTKLQVEIDKEIADLEEYDREQKTDLRKQRDERIREILLEIEKIITDYAKKENYSIILNDKVLIYADESLEITEPILKILNDKYANQSK